jgi:uncharacterized sulfatase
MLRRCFAVLSLLLLANITRAAPPNVLMIVADDQAYTDYGFMGHETIRTPHLDKLAAQSAVFPRGYVPDSLCRPSLATLITGLYPHQHRISGNDPLFERIANTPLQRQPEYLRLNAEFIRHIDNIPTLPRLLGEAGYLSLETGKWWEGSYARGGFTHGMTHGDPARGGRHGDAGLAIGRDGLQPIYDFIADAGERPWFVWYAPLLPHSPHNPPQRLLDKYADDGQSLHVARYQAMCQWSDELIGQLLDHLDEHGLADNTLVVYVADNGWIQNEDNPQYAPRSKRSPYEGGIRTPILLRWPGHIEAARYDDTLVSSIDLAPTILAAAGLKSTGDMPGLNLLEVAQQHGRTTRDAVYGAIYEHDVPDLDDPGAGMMYRWVIAGRWKLIVPAAGTPEELYDLRSDPHELHNHASDEPGRVADLLARLDGVVPAGARNGRAND